MSFIHLPFLTHEEVLYKSMNDEMWRSSAVYVLNKISVMVVYRIYISIGTMYMSWYSAWFRRTYQLTWHFGFLSCAWKQWVLERPGGQV